mgnify:CR=1 FL=1
MMVSSRGRYALRVLLDLAEHAGEGFVPMKAIAQRQEISKKYMEQIMPVLVKNGLVEGVQGKGGGYRLTHSPDQYRVGEILRLTEGDLAPVTCLSCHATPCSRASECRTIAMWSRFNQVTNDFFDAITLTDLLEGKA